LFTIQNDTNASFTKFKSGLLSFTSGSDCLDDFNGLRKESLNKELWVGGIFNLAMGDFLRSFSSMSLESLSAELCDIALNLRLRTHPEELYFILINCFKLYWSTSKHRGIMT